MAWTYIAMNGRWRQIENSWRLFKRHKTRKWWAEQFSMLKMHAMITVMNEQKR